LDNLGYQGAKKSLVPFQRHSMLSKALGFEEYKIKTHSNPNCCGAIK